MAGAHAKSTDRMRRAAYSRNIFKMAMELVQAAIILLVAVASIAYLFTRQRKEYAQHVSQLQPKKEKRSKPRPEFRTYTRAEVAMHNTAQDAWIIVKDKRDGVLKVYDISEYVDEHPGGEAILNNVGGDATEGFYGPQHPEAVFEMVKTYLIGKIEE